jgi:hypothetical protein
VIYDVLGQVLQQGAEEGEVRDYPTEGKGGHGGVKTVRAAAVRSPGVDTRPRREREGCSRVAGEGEKWEGRKWGCGSNGEPF